MKKIYIICIGYLFIAIGTDECLCACLPKMFNYPNHKKLPAHHRHIVLVQAGVEELDREKAKRDEAWQNFSNGKCLEEFEKELNGYDAEELDNKYEKFQKFLTQSIVYWYFVLGAPRRSHQLVEQFAGFLAEIEDEVSGDYDLLLSSDWEALCATVLDTSSKMPYIEALLSRFAEINRAVPTEKASAQFYSFSRGVPLTIEEISRGFRIIERSILTVNHFLNCVRRGYNPESWLSDECSTIVEAFKEPDWAEVMQLRSVFSKNCQKFVAGMNTETFSREIDAYSDENLLKKFAEMEAVLDSSIIYIQRVLGLPKNMLKDVYVLFDLFVYIKQTSEASGNETNFFNHKLDKLAYSELLGIFDAINSIKPYIEKTCTSVRSKLPAVDIMNVGLLVFDYSKWEWIDGRIIQYWFEQAWPALSSIPHTEEPPFKTLMMTLKDPTDLSRVKSDYDSAYKELQADVGPTKSSSITSKHNDKTLEEGSLGEGQKDKTPDALLEEWPIPKEDKADDARSKGEKQLWEKFCDALESCLIYCQTTLGFKGMLLDLKDFRDFLRYLEELTVDGAFNAPSDKMLQIHDALFNLVDIMPNMTRALILMCGEGSAPQYKDKRFFSSDFASGRLKSPLDIIELIDKAARSALIISSLCHLTNYGADRNYIDEVKNGLTHYDPSYLNYYELQCRNAWKNFAEGLVVPTDHNNDIFNRDILNINIQAFNGAINNLDGDQLKAECTALDEFLECSLIYCQKLVGLNKCYLPIEEFSEFMCSLNKEQMYNLHHSWWNCKELLNMLKRISYAASCREALKDALKALYSKGAESGKVGEDFMAHLRSSKLFCKRRKLSDVCCAWYDASSEDIEELANKASEKAESIINGAHRPVVSTRNDYIYQYDDIVSEGNQPRKRKGKGRYDENVAAKRKVNNSQVI